MTAAQVLDDFVYEVLRCKIHPGVKEKVRFMFSSSSPLSSRSKMGHKINKVILSFEDVFAESNKIGIQAVQLMSSLPDNLKEKRVTLPYLDDSKIVGREHDVSCILNLLIGSKYMEELPVITISGMGGLGKTTLAQLIYKNDLVKTHFDRTMWICVSGDFNVGSLLSEILQSLTGNNYHSVNVEVLVKKLRGQLLNKRYLLVLDDVWNKNGEEWDAMKTCLLEIGGSKGSRILATTRSEEVVCALKTSGLHQLQVLSEDQSWSLFKKCVFGEGGAVETPQLIQIGERILKRCGSVPLAIKAMGSLLYSKNSELEWSTIERTETWNASTGENGVLSILKLSYDHLPSLSLKQCFAYCAIFPKDTLMEKDRLIQLWSAQGLLNPPQGSYLQMEDVGEIYFNILCRNSLLQAAQKDHDNDITHCKMHDLVHDVSLLVSQNYCFHAKDGKFIDNEIDAMHISVDFGEMGMCKSLKDILPSKLRTLHVKGCDLLENLLEKFKCLTILIVIGKSVRELPNVIGRAKHLRYLDICRTRITRLPKSFTKLYYLQTLRVDYLTEVPKRFGDLISLRHFHMERDPFEIQFQFDMDGKPCKILFPGLGQLQNLRTLSLFQVGRCKKSGIEELENLNNLRGTLRIWSLQNVDGYESAVKSRLSMKANIQSLELHWDEREEECDDTDVMEGLKPHSNLKSLTINGYRSLTFPAWMVMKNDLLLLRNLVQLTLNNLERCTSIPSLGDLPYLQSLEIFSFNVKSIDKEFYGWQDSDLVSKTEITIFPSLRILGLFWMKSLQHWSDLVIRAPHSSKVRAFPCLERMYVSSIPELSIFPNLGTLQSLEVFEVRNCENLTLSVDCPSLVQFQSLQKLHVSNCDKLTSSFCSLKSLALLDSLQILTNPSFWPEDLRCLTNLRELHLGAGRGLKDLECDHYPWPYSKTLNDATSLVSLTLDGFRLPKVVCLPLQIQHLPTLRSLQIENFDGLEALPEWLGNFESLQDLSIWYCKNLKKLPSLGAFLRLVYLDIRGCPLLKSRCTRESGSEWPKISHISNVILSDY